MHEKVSMSDKKEGRKAHVRYAWSEAGPRDRKVLTVHAAAPTRHCRTRYSIMTKPTHAKVIKAARRAKKELLLPRSKSAIHRGASEGSTEEAESLAER